MAKLIYLRLFTLFLFSFSYNSFAADGFSISATIETPQVAINGNADDPAIWINQEDPSLSIVFGTDKYNGIYSYNLKGEIIGFSKSGRMNNVDLRSLKENTYIFATDTSNNTINLWIYKNSLLQEKSKEGKFILDVIPHYKKEVNFLAYGTCAGIYKNNDLIIFVTEAMGPGVQLWKFTDNKLSLVNTFNNSNAYESEGCVYDDENEKLFISEENKKGIIRSYSLSNELLLTDKFEIDDREGGVVGDPEGLALLKTNKTDGYLIASSQGNNTFNIYNRKFPHQFIDSFQVVKNSNIDGVSDTDGIEIVNTYLNKDFPKGLIVVQDGKNTGENTISKENFKFISLDNLNQYLVF